MNQGFQGGRAFAGAAARYVLPRLAPFVTPIPGAGPLLFGLTAVAAAWAAYETMLALRNRSKAGFSLSCGPYTLEGAWNHHCYQSGLLSCGGVGNSACPSPPGAVGVHTHEVGRLVSNPNRYRVVNSWQNVGGGRWPGAIPWDFDRPFDDGGKRALDMALAALLPNASPYDRPADFALSMPLFAVPARDAYHRSLVWAGMGQIPQRGYYAPFAPAVSIPRWVHPTAVAAAGVTMPGNRTRPLIPPVVGVGDLTGTNVVSTPSVVTAVDDKPRVVVLPPVVVPVPKADVVPGRIVIASPQNRVSTAPLRIAAAPATFAPRPGEIKTRAYPIVSQLMHHAVGLPTELNDMLQAMYDALPNHCKNSQSSRRTRQDKAIKRAGGYNTKYKRVRNSSANMMRDIAGCMGSMNLAQAVVNLVDETLVDRASSPPMANPSRAMGMPLESILNKRPGVDNIQRNARPKPKAPFEFYLSPPDMRRSGDFKRRTVGGAMFLSAK